MITMTWISYILYSYFVFFYVAKIFGKPVLKIPTLIILSIINSPLVIYALYFAELGREEAVMIAYFIILAVEISVCFKLDYISTIAATQCFTINYFGMKVLIIGIMSRVDKSSVTDLLWDYDRMMLVQIFCFTILAIYIMISSKILIHSVVRYLFADRQSLILCCVLLGAVLINHLLALPTLYAEEQYSRFNSVYQIRAGIVAMVYFIIIMVAVFVYSKLRKASISYNDTAVSIRNDNVEIHKLEKEIITDFFTGFFVRSIAIEKLKDMLEAKKYCYVLFVDLDGLKNVNDNFGHEEGDTYIRKASEYIKKNFCEDTISRIGGDEFLIVGDYQEHDIKNKVQKCYDEVLSIGQGYETSISYGFVEVDENNTHSHDELIELADRAMYNFKKSRNKERKDRQLSYN